jgi:hypothetical protein
MIPWIRTSAVGMVSIDTKRGQDLPKAGPAPFLPGHGEG